MKLISRTSHIDDATYEPAHHLTLEISQVMIEDVVTHRSMYTRLGEVPQGLDLRKEFVQVLGERLMEILEEEFQT